jgi:hypothetical protein
MISGWQLDLQKMITVVKGKVVVAGQAFLI